MEQKIKIAEIIKIESDFNNAVQKAKMLYLNGSVFIYPTDTIYGFGANPFNEEAVSRIKIIKERPVEKLYIMLVDSMSTLLKYAEIKSDRHLDFLLTIWPNPVSVVLPLNKKTSSIINSTTAAFRIPNQRFCLKLLNELKMPLISTSVNRANCPPLIYINDIEENFSSEVEAIFYTDSKSFHETSTLIDLCDEKPKVLREGRYKTSKLLSGYK